ncbi:MAG: ATP-dependent Clp protease ATP-binding subunit [Anaerolineaceae bacterium]|jgi:ATP-dependent Clp protease ATP-binding subunit ClpC|nr:ATP-dependent Clp protease ATP-binding subunit [Anaerolineaceae bacterium]
MAGMNKFTQKAKRVLSIAQQEAEAENAPWIGSEHLLIALCTETGTAANRVMEDLNIKSDGIRKIVAASHEVLKDKRGQEKADQTSPLELSDDMKKLLEQALTEAEADQAAMVGTEHLLLAMSRNESSFGMWILSQLGVTPEQIQRQTARVMDEYKRMQDAARKAETTDDLEKSDVISRRGVSRRKEKDEGKTPLVDQLATDLTGLAEEGKLDPVIGRTKEIERVIQILARRTKNNPALIGEPGVGKTAIVEGLAQRIVEGDVPALLLDKRVLQLDVGSMVAGTMYRGQFEERLKRVIDELKSSGDIVFIDEVHMLVGAGSAGSSVDAANILKPALSRGELQVIGATTANEYRKNIESDAALERRFQPIVVDQPSVEETIEILHGLRPNYEEHHRLTISDEALEAAAKLSARYVTERFLPDKAIDLVDEAASRVRMYKSESALSSKDLVAELRNTRKELKSADPLEDADNIQALLKRQETLEEQLHGVQTAWNRSEAPVVSENDIAEVISMWTGIPLTQIETEETERLLNMEAELSKSIIGQEEAIVAVSKAIRRARAGLKSTRRPIGSFMFLGPTGVGKTELTKSLARQMFGSEDALIQIDMSEFMERHSMSRLVGAPPGYVGYDEAGQLTEAIRRKPYSIVVFDEVEKAHPEALNMLLQIMEEGHLSDAKGLKVDFRNAIIIMTTNIGADLIRRQSGLGFPLTVDEAQEEEQEYKEMQKKLMEALKRNFRPEFINRLDSVIVFRALNRKDIRQIVALEIDKVTERLEEQEIKLIPTEAALTYLSELGYDPEMGARPVRRVITQQVEERLADELLAKRFKPGDTIQVDLGEVTNADGETEKQIVLNHLKNQEEQAAPELIGI